MQIYHLFVCRRVPVLVYITIRRIWLVWRCFSLFFHFESYRDVVSSCWNCKHTYALVSVNVNFLCHVDVLIGGMKTLMNCLLTKLVNKSFLILIDDHFLRRRRINSFFIRRGLHYTEMHVGLFLHTSGVKFFCQRENFIQKRTFYEVTVFSCRFEKLSYFKDVTIHSKGNCKCQNVWWKKMCCGLVTPKHNSRTLHPELDQEKNFRTCSKYNFFRKIEYSTMELHTLGGFILLFSSDIHIVLMNTLELMRK